MRCWPRYWRPIVFENSWVPVALSKLAPIEVWACSAGPFVWCRGELSDRTRTHETIHFQQQLELLFVGQWLLYGLFWLLGFIRFRDGRRAYRLNPFEQEAYDNDDGLEPWLDVRPRYGWTEHVKTFLRKGD